MAGSLILEIIVVLIQIIIPYDIGRSLLLSYLPYLVIFGFLKVLSQVFGNILNSLFFQGYRNICEVVSSLLKLILLFLAIKLDYGVWGLVASYGLADLLLSLLYFAKLYVPLYASAELLSESENIPSYRFLKYGLNEYLYKLFWFFTDNRIDIYIVTYFLGIVTAGYFTFAINVVNLIIEWSPAFIIRTVISPLFVRQYTKNKKTSELEYLFQLHTKFLIFLTFPIFLFIGVLGEKIVTYIFDPKYITSINTILIFLFFMFFINILIPIRNILSVLERTDISNYSNLSAIFKFPLLFFLLKSYGINGAALAYGISLLIILAFNLIMMRKIFNPVYPWEAILRITLNVLIAGFGLYLLKDNISGIASLLFAILIGFIIYAVTSLYNKPFNNYDRELLNKGFKTPLWHF